MTIPENVISPFSEKFEETWVLWKIWRKEYDNFRYKGVISEQMALKKLAELSEGVEEKAVAIIEQSIERQWTGFYKVKNSPTNGKSKQSTPKSTGEPPASNTEKFKREFMQRNGGGEQDGDGSHLKAV